MNSGRPVLDPLVLAKLGNLQLRARMVVEGFASGLHKSPAYGHSLEFSEHRPYAYGDELKHLDWKIFGKTDRFTIKRYEDETTLRAMFLVDNSASMSFGTTAGWNKWEYARTLAACLCTLILRQQDAAGLAIMGARGKTAVAPRSGRGHLSVLVDRLTEASPEKGEFSLSAALKDIGTSLKRRGLMIVISDLFDDQDAVLESLSFFRYKKHEVIVFQVLDPAEKALPWKGPVRFEDLENNQQLVTETEVIGPDYERRMKAFVDRYAVAFRKAGIDYCLLTTSDPLEHVLGYYLSRREQ